MVRKRPVFGRKRGHKVFFHVERSFAAAETEPVTHSEHVRVNRYVVAAERHAHHHVCGFAPHALKRQQIVEIIGYSPAEPADYIARSRNYARRFVAVKSATEYKALQIFDIGVRKILGRILNAKQLFGNFVYALIGALRRKYHRHQ